MTVEEFRNSTFHVGMRAKGVCFLMDKSSSPMVGTIGSVNFDQALIGICQDGQEFEDETDLWWFRCENVELINNKEL